MDKCVKCENDFEDAGFLCHNCYMVLQVKITRLEGEKQALLDKHEAFQNDLENLLDAIEKKLENVEDMTKFMVRRNLEALQEEEK